MSDSLAAWSSRIRSSSGMTLVRSAASASSTAWVTCGSEVESARRALPAASATVLPNAAASMTFTDSSGTHSRDHTSLKVPLEEACCWLAQSTPRMPIRYRNRDRSRSRGLRRSSVSFLGEALRGRRRLLALERRSASRGTMGTPSGTTPRASPTRTSRVARAARVALPSHMTDRTASPSSSEPGRGRPRMAARAWARRAASIMWAEETGRSWRRREAATRVNQRMTGWSGAVNRWWYQPGEATPAP